MSAAVARKGNVVTLLDVPSTDDLTEEALADLNAKFETRISGRHRRSGQWSVSTPSCA